MKRCILWLRRDLRLTDNPALLQALDDAEQIVPVYIHAPEEEGRWRPGAASRWWLHHSLKSLDEALRQRGSRLLIRHGSSLTCLSQLIEELGAEGVYWNRLYEPAIIARDKMIKQSLRERGITAESFNAALLFEPWQIRTGQGTPYKVFTPFWRACTPQLSDVGKVRAAPRKIPTAASVTSTPLAELNLLPRISWDGGLAAAWAPGEAAALQLLKQFSEQRIEDYADDRNRPDVVGTSRLSPHLHFGEIGPRQVVATVLQLAASAAREQRGADTYVKEIGWREFAHHLLYHFPHTAAEPMDPRFNRFAWSNDRSALEAWQCARTGIPIIDAGMRELWATGWMHNRVRMVVASFLTKNLRVNWLEGAHWFWDTLVDADLANNTLGWQWTAGCGADAAPFVRVFNPVLQAERFDPERVYLRRWLPELALLPDELIHRPWEAGEEDLAAAGVVLGRNYPRPFVDLAASRTTALATYDVLRGAQ